MTISIDRMPAKTSGYVDSGRAVTGRKSAPALVLFLSLSIVFADVGCSAGQDNLTDGGPSVSGNLATENSGKDPVGARETPPNVPVVSESPPPEDPDAAGQGTPEYTNVAGEKTPKDARTAGEGLREGTAVTGENAEVVMFPIHDAPLGTDNGGRYYAGRLVLNEGCLRVEVPPDANGLDVSRLLIWPSGYALSVKDGSGRIVDGVGRVAARVGDYVRLSHSEFTLSEARDRGLIRGLSEDCAGPYLLVGDEVTAYHPNYEPAELNLPDPSVFFYRQKTVVADVRDRPLAGGIGELALDGHCLRLRGGPTIIWPAGFTPHVYEGLVQVRNGAGRIITQVGDQIAGGGSHGSSAYGECPGDSFAIHSISVLPDVEVYFLKQDGTLGTDQDMERFEGKLVLNRKCLEVDAPIRVRDRALFHSDRPLIIWPDSFTLSLEQEVVRIIDAGGRVVASVGDEIEFSAVSVSYQEALEHGGLREITPACSGPYWVVGDDFAAVSDSESP